MTRDKPSFNIGDEVMIVSPKKCAWGSNAYMEKLEGKTRKISGRSWSSSKNRYCYRIGDDNGYWSWSADCFEPIIPIELPSFDINTDISDLFM